MCAVSCFPMLHRNDGDEPPDPLAGCQPVEGGCAMSKYQIEVTQLVEVELDESKFDETFMEEFRQSFYSFDTLQEHAEHIAQLQARGIIELDTGSEFVEGYGPSKDMGIRARVLDTNIDVVRA